MKKTPQKPISQYIIQLSNVEKTYNVGGRLYKALDNINLSIKTGEFIVLMGPSGSGKSTLLNLIGGLDRPSAGHIKAFDEDLSKIKEKALDKFRSQQIGFIFQSFNLLQNLTAEENVQISLDLQNKPNNLALVKDILAELGLTNRTQNKPSELSGGEQQRVAIARAIIKNPSIILADEPTGNLDTKNGEEVMSIFKSLHKTGKTLIVVTHNPEIAKQADRIVRILDGKISE